ncbi:TlpA disulfide reductase family protein [Pedobacter sp. B4-66]|uniref:TlpA family protein disulfide reductase n=1 Tax=Pedobacter sp. B4-66 TaxID=2817280 RepID=UPI001BD9B0A4|nr:TlpA disulfide reductase family protein [Pedobacter sp. B4-66]
MKKSFFLWALSLLLLFSKDVNSKSQSIVLYGRIDPSLTNTFGTKVLNIKINETTNPYNQGEIKKTPINSDGTFCIKINTIDPFIYLSFWMINNDNGRRPTSPSNLQNLNSHYGTLEEVYLFKNGDSINVSVYKDGSFNFTGNGSEKLNCQYNLYSITIPENIKALSLQLINSNNYKESFELKDKIAQLLIKLKLSVLDSYKNNLSKDLYMRLYLDIFGYTESEIQEELHYYITEPDSLLSERKKEIHNYFQKTNLQDSISVVNSEYLAESAYYPELIFNKVLNKYSLYNSANNHTQGDFFKKVYEHLKKNYSGKLRDKLLLICYQRLSPNYSEDAKSFLDDALSIIIEGKYKVLLEEWGRRQNKAFPFELEDVNGKLHKLDDYLGKLIVIDFWFTGCSWCANLNTAMQTIVEKYKDNKEIVFITVCTDQHKDKWIESLKNNKYTSAGTINLYTNGLGTEHPFLKFYNLIGAPRQLIIDKKGNLVTSSPPRPDDGLIFLQYSQGSLLIPNPQSTLSNPSAKAFMEILNSKLSN